MYKTHKRIQTSMRFKPETLKILDHHQSERAIPRTYLIETIIGEWHAQQMGPQTGSVYVDPRAESVPGRRMLGLRVDDLEEQVGHLKERVEHRTIDTSEMDGVEDLLVKCVKDVEDNRRSIEKRMLTMEKLIGILLDRRFRDHMHNNPTDGKLTVTDKMVEDLMALADE